MILLMPFCIYHDDTFFKLMTVECTFMNCLLYYLNKHIYHYYIFHYNNYGQAASYLLISCYHNRNFYCPMAVMLRI